jgi:DNA ligase-1
MTTSLEQVVATATTVAAASARNDKVAALAELLAAIDAAEASIVVGLLTGEIRQGRIGVGWAAVRDLDIAPAETSSLSIHDVDTAMVELMEISGSGSKARRAAVLEALFERATEGESSFLQTVLTGGLRQGALDGVMTTAIAKAAGAPVASVRRAAMFSGDLGETAAVALGDGSVGLDAIGLRVGRGVQPMLASTSASAAEAVAELDGEVSVQAKLDGIRLQVHRNGDRVWLFTRNLNDVTERLPAVCALVRSLRVEQVVLDGELIGISEDAPEMFQDTASTFSSGGESGRVALLTQFFDILHRDGEDLVDLPLSERLLHLEAVAGEHMIEGIISRSAGDAEAFSQQVLAAGHEGVVVKSIDSVYAAGRRGKTWRKVKPVHTYDLVVLAAEWGHGRRTGWLSNLHLGARDSSSGEFVMVGKTFKGLTDALLKWQTEAFLERETHREDITVFVHPELVVEIAIDGVQRSTTYPGDLALRFARVKQYRPDKAPQEANTLEDLRTLIR